MNKAYKGEPILESKSQTQHTEADSPTPGKAGNLGMEDLVESDAYQRIDETGEKEAKARVVAHPTVALRRNGNGEVEEVTIEKLWEDATDNPANVALRIMREGTYVTIQETDEILDYKTGRYVKGAEPPLRKKIQEIAGIDITSNPFVSEVLGKIRRATYHSIKDFDKDDMIINLKNGLLDVRTGKVEPHSPRYLSLQQLPLEYDPSQQGARFQKFMEEVLPIRVFRERAYEMMAACLYRKQVKKAWLLHGKKDTAKSTFLEILTRFLSLENVSNVTLQLLEERFNRYNLVGKLVNICGDNGKERIQKSPVFKMITGGDRLDVERKGLQPFPAYVHAKLVVACNDTPVTSDESDSFFGRWVPILFEVSFPEGADVKFAYKDGSGEWTTKRDSSLVEKLTTPSELSGILSLLLPRLKRIASTGQVQHSPSEEEVREWWLNKSNHVREFIDETIELDASSLIPRDELYSRYAKWCTDKKRTPLSRTKFNPEMEKFGARRYDGAKTKANDKSVDSWKGIQYQEARLMPESNDETPLVLVEKSPEIPETPVLSSGESGDSAGLPTTEQDAAETSE